MTRKRRKTHMRRLECPYCMHSFKTKDEFPECPACGREAEVDARCAITNKNCPHRKYCYARECCELRTKVALCNAMLDYAVETSTSKLLASQAQKELNVLQA
jgi:hypothetical protein